MQKSIKNLFLVSTLCFISIRPNTIDPLSKIVVTSEKATGKTNPHDKTIFTFSYQGNVKTVFADNSEITCKQLDLCIDKTGISTSSVVTSLTKEVKHDALSQLKTILFKDNVSIKRASETIKADKVELDTQKRCCMLQGNVSIIKNKTSKTDVPINMKSDRAMLSLDSGAITFLGTEKKPVTTVLNIADLSLIKKESKTKKA